MLLCLETRFYSLEIAACVVMKMQIIHGITNMPAMKHYIKTCLQEQLKRRKNGKMVSLYEKDEYKIPINYFTHEEMLKKDAERK
ncbi:hypothetical protein HHI36_007408 [Cryptolaemus montrouzieri]|uniref:Uncharacterized protein n=1 Tax=Cryptolaemus montrouzieri TaxID=559131 RepID=A0ABD2MPQ4_9CUCU